MSAQPSAIDFRTYHEETLPRLLAEGRGILAAPIAERFGNLAFRARNTDLEFTYRLNNGTISVERGRESAETVIAIEASDWAGFVADLETAPGLLYGEQVECLKGDMMAFVQWDPGLRALYQGRPLYDPDSVELKNRHGEIYPPNAIFSLADSPEDLSDFLDAAGYLHVRNVFTVEEIASFRNAATLLRKGAREGDQTSWWGRNEAGDAVLSRILNGGDSNALNWLHRDSRIKQLCEIPDEDLRVRPPGDKDGVTVIFKSPHMVEGLSDLPWHRDCGMGGHAIMCPTVVASIYLYDATPESGCLEFLPASHKSGSGFSVTGQADAPTGIRPKFRAGDLSLHYGDVMHSAPSPESDQGPFRESILICFTRDYEPHRGERHYNDILLGDEEGQISNLEEIVREGS